MNVGMYLFKVVLTQSFRINIFFAWKYEESKMPTSFFFSKDDGRICEYCTHI